MLTDVALISYWPTASSTVARSWIVPVTVEMVTVLSVDATDSITHWYSPNNVIHSQHQNGSFLQQIQCRYSWTHFIATASISIVHFSWGGTGTRLLPGSGWVLYYPALPRPGRVLLKIWPNPDPRICLDFYDSELYLTQSNAKWAFVLRPSLMHDTVASHVTDNCPLGPSRGRADGNQLSGGLISHLTWHIATYVSTDEAIAQRNTLALAASTNVTFLKAKPGHFWLNCTRLCMQFAFECSNYRIYNVGVTAWCLVYISMTFTLMLL